MNIYLYLTNCDEYLRGVQPHFAGFIHEVGMPEWCLIKEVEITLENKHQSIYDCAISALEKKRISLEAVQQFKKDLANG